MVNCKYILTPPSKYLGCLIVWFSIMYGLLVLVICISIFYHNVLKEVKLIYDQYAACQRNLRACENLISEITTKH